jgi:DNA-binding NarL/FixJ family response regulator
MLIVTLEPPPCAAFWSVTEVNCMPALPPGQLTSSAARPGHSTPREHRPDIVLMDVTMPGMNGLEATHIIRAEIPSCRVIMVSQHDSQAFMREALRAGASGYVTKSDATADLITEIRRVQELHVPTPSQDSESLAE